MRSFLGDERGLETVEYAILAALVVAGVVVIILALGNWIVRRFSNMQQSLRDA